MLIIYSIVIIIFLIINNYIYKKFWNYLNVFLLIWYLVLVLSMQGFYDFYVPSDRAYIYILIALAALEVFSILFMNLTIKKKKKKTEDEKYKLKYLSITLLAFLVTILMIPTTIKGINVLANNGFGALRTEGLSAGTTYTTIERLFLVYILKPFNTALLTYSIIDFIDKNKIKANLILCIINVFQQMLTFGGRSALLGIVLLIFVVIVDKYGKKILQIVKDNKKIVIGAIAIIGVIIYITSQRRVGGGEGLLFNIYTYFVGSIHLFGVCIDNPSTFLLDGQNLLYGQAMFNWITELINFTGGFLFNISITTGLEIVNQVTQNFVNVSPTVVMNNNVTMLYIFLRDFDVWGLIIGPMVLALVYVWAYKARKNKRTLISRAIYYYLLSQMPYFLFEYILAKGNVVFVIIFMLLIYRIVSTRERTEKIEEKLNANLINNIDKENKNE